MKSAGAPSWTLSFADLCLLLLGFFIMLHAQTGQQAKLVDGIKQAFGGQSVPLSESHQLDPARLFEPGEALLRPQARAQLVEMGRRAAERRERVRIESIGVDPASRRFDGWELAAARTAAIGRAVQTGGLSDQAITISIPAMSATKDKTGQRIAIEVLKR